jgi:hypothetical protein
MKLYHGSTYHAGHTYDLVMGPVANDKIYTTINLYESNVLSVEETIARLRVSEFFNQISFHSDAAMSEVRFIKSEEIETSFAI